MITLVVLSVAVPTTANANTPCTLTVPTTSGALHGAADALAALLSSVDSAADVVVCLAPGVHTLAGRTLRLGSEHNHCLLYTSPSPRDLSTSRMPSSA